MGEIPFWKQQVKKTVDNYVTSRAVESHIRLEKIINGQACTCLPCTHAAVKDWNAWAAWLSAGNTEGYQYGVDKTGKPYIIPPSNPKNNHELP